jgi:hypothetical protein
MTTRALRLLILFLSAMLFHSSASSQSQHPQVKKDRDYAILFERTGGYTGSHDRFRIYLDGRVEDERGLVKTVHPMQVSAIKKSFDALLDARARGVKHPTCLCSDCYYYRVTIATGKGIRSLGMSEPLPVKSDSLARLVQELRDLLFSR